MAASRMGLLLALGAVPKHKRICPEGFRPGTITTLRGGVIRISDPAVVREAARAARPKGWRSGHPKALPGKGPFELVPEGKGCTLYHWGKPILAWEGTEAVSVYRQLRAVELAEHLVSRGGK